MGKKFDIFYFSSTHWDREWYQDFQGFRYRLVKMIDNLLELCEKDSEYKTFHFDGQTVVLEDYAEISPEKTEKLKELIKERRILVGPWYVMPDEFLVSGESLIRNLMKGHEVSKQWGQEAWKYGYICDIFGHIAQMPQIFNGFDINYSLLGRGTTESQPTFFRWQSPDGSECLNYKLEPNDGYGNFKLHVYGNVDDKTVNNPEITERLKNYIDKELERAEVPVVIIMDGLDHAEAFTGTTEYIKKIAELYPDAEIHHTDLRRQGEMLEKYKDELPVIQGELNRTAEKQHGYLHLITNTLSSYYPIKQQNDRCQNMLEKQTEPLCALSALEGIKLNRSFVKKAYEYLLKNHPHDSICGCSIDRVHKDMEYRFDQADGLCSALREDYLKTKLEGSSCGEEYENVLTLYNLLPYNVDKTVTVELDFPQNYPATYQEPFGFELINSFKIYDSCGEEIPYQVIDIKRGITRRLYDQVTAVRDAHTVTFRAFVPACGNAKFRIVPSKTPVRYLEKMVSGADYAENEYIRFDILNNGSLKITDKKTGKVYSQLGNFVDDGEIGDGWYHANPVNDTVVNSCGGACVIEKVESGPSRCVFRIIRYMELPESMVYDRFGKRRSENRVKVKFVTYAGLSAENRYVDFKMNYDNNACDHRLRMTVPTGINSETYFSGQAFCCVERKAGIDYGTQFWREHDQYEKSTNGIFGRRDTDGCGLAFVSAEGLHECAAYNDSEGTMSVTLSRSFRKTVMTNDESRCQLNRNLSYEFAIATLDNDVQYCDLLKIQDGMASGMLQTFECVDADADLPAPESMLSVGGDNVAVSVIKLPENGEKNAVVVRVFNTSDKASTGFVQLSRKIAKAEKVNLNEETEYEVPVKDNKVEFEILPWKIMTFKICY